MRTLWQVHMLGVRADDVRRVRWRAGASLFLLRSAHGVDPGMDVNEACGRNARSAHLPQCAPALCGQYLDEGVSGVWQGEVAA